MEENPEGERASEVSTINILVTMFFAALAALYLLFLAE